MFYMKKIVKIQIKRQIRNGKEYHTFYITLPKELVEILGWREGDQVLVTIENGKLIISKI